MTRSGRRREQPRGPGRGRRRRCGRPRSRRARAHRGGTLRVAVTAPPTPRPCAEPRGSGELGPLLSLVYDGLVAYRRAGGSAGGTLVADLARELPEPSPDGRTYRFRLRPDVRFSNGAPVRPADVRASLERLLAVTRRRTGRRLPADPWRGAMRRQAVRSLRGDRD